MGAWGVGNFENDSGLDWMYDFLESENQIATLKEVLKVSTIRQGLLGKLFRKKEAMDEPEATAILVAGEIVALLVGNPSTDLPEDLENWGKQNQLRLEKDLVRDALDAIQSMKEHSELKVLWEGTDDFQNWLHEVYDLESRLKNGL